MVSPAKKVKKTKYKTNFNPDWMRTYDFIISKCSSSVPDYKTSFHCNVCNADISSAHGRINDVKKHINTPSHKKNADITKKGNMEQYLQQPSSSNVIHPSIQAEVKIAVLLVHHNSFFNLSDHLTREISNKFEGSSAAEKFACGRTKTAAIINCVGSHMKKALVKDMKNNPFSIMLDGSNDVYLILISVVS